MNGHQSQHFTSLVASKNIPTNVRLAPLTGKPTQPFRFLDLPPEIRRTIYDLWVPTILHVSLGLKGIRLQHFLETRSGLHFSTLSNRPFFLNRQFYQEFRYALFTRSTWCFSSTDLLPKVFARLPKATWDKIRHVLVRLTAHGTTEESAPARLSDDRLNLRTFQLAQRLLRQMNGLQTLGLSINLADFRRTKSDSLTRNLAPETGTANILAANCVADFTWDGLQTWVPFAQSNLSREFMDTLRRRCGDANVSLVLKHKDRYAGQMVDVIISQSTVLE